MLLLGLAFTSAGGACPFCAWMGGRAPPLQRVLAESEIVGVARPAEGEGALALLDPDTPRLVRLVVEHVGKGAGHLSPGDAFEAEVSGTLRADDRFLVSGAAEDVATASLRLRPLTTQGAAVVVAWLALPPREGLTLGESAARRQERLAFFLPHLKHRDPVVAEAAYAEFSQASYAELLGLEDLLDPDVVAGWIEDPRWPYNRGLLFLMLGISGFARHRDLLGATLDRSLDPRPGLDGLLGAWLLLAGPAGIPRIQTRLASAATPSEARRLAVAYVAALRFHETETSVLPPTSLRDAYRFLLRDPAYADLGVEELLRRKDWECHERILALWRAHKEDHPFLDSQVRAWLRAAPEPEAAAASGDREPGPR